MKIFLQFIVFLTLSLSFSCSHISYKSKNSIPLGINWHELHQDSFTIYGQKEFYLWGKIPSKTQYVDIDQEIISHGFSAASAIYIEEFQSPGNFFITLLTFGMYMPIDYMIRGEGVKPSGN